MRQLRFAAAVLGTIALAATFVAVATADDDDGDKRKGFTSNVASMLTCPTCDRNIPVLTVGETIPGTSYKFEAIPDGIAIHDRGGGRRRRRPLGRRR